MREKFYYNIDQTEIAVLVTNTYGAGWSTWNSNPEIAWDPRVIKYWLSCDEEFNVMASRYDTPQQEELIAKMKEFGYEDLYCGGWKNLEIEWVPIGSVFRVREYDGAEGVEILNLNEWEVASR